MKKKPILIVFFALILILMAAGVWWLFQSGRLVYVANTADKTSTRICGSDVVKKYNEAFVFEADELTIDTQKIDTIISDMKSTEGYGDDPTCRTILLWSAIRSDVYADAQEQYEALISLSEKGLFADTGLRDVMPLDNYRIYIESLTGNESADFGG